jgi:hypothetical protein
MSNARKKLLVLGDSWVYGAELKNPDNDSWPVLLGKILDIDVKNFGVPATSLDHVVQLLLSNFNHSPEYVDWHHNKDIEYSLVLAVTGSTRSMYFENREFKEIHINTPGMAVESYYKYLYSEEMRLFNLHRNIILIQNFCNVFNINVCFVSNWESIPTHNLIDQSLWHKKSLVEILGIENFDTREPLITKMSENPYIFPNRNHPNEQGHIKIASELAEWLKNDR